MLLITDLKIGGTPTVVRELAVRLRSPEVHVEVACLSPWGPVADQLQQAGVPVTALDAAGMRDLPGVVRRLTRLIRERRFDTVFSFLIHANAVAAAAFIFCPGVRFVQSIQTTQPRPRWHWWLQRLVHRAAGKVAVPSESIAQVAQDWAHVPAERIVIIPNAIDPEGFAPLMSGTGGSSVRSEEHGRGAPATAWPIGFIGRLDPIKRIPDLLEAVRLLDGRVHLHVFGEGADRDRITAEIARLGVGSHVTMHGAVARPQEALSRVGLLVLPSEAEGFGLVLIEAMAAGVPVVATNVAGIRNVVRDGETGLLVPVSNPKELASAIAKVMDDEPLRQSLTRQAAHDVCQRFTWSQVLPQYHSLLGIAPNPQCPEGPIQNHDSTALGSEARARREAQARRELVEVKPKIQNPTNPQSPILNPQSDQS